MRLKNTLLLSLLCLAAVGCAQRPVSPASESGAQQEKGVLRYVDLVNLDVRDVPLMLALEDLEAQGHTVERTYMASSAVMADALARGDADIGMMNNQTMWMAIAKGAPVRTIATFTASTTVLAAQSEIQSCRDLDGRPLAVAAPRGLSPVLLSTYLEQNCPDANPRRVVIPESTGRAAALLSGEVDAEVVPGEELAKLQMEAPGRFHAIMSFAESFPDVQIDGFHVRLGWAEENPEGVKDFLRALLKAQRRVKSNPELLWRVAAERLSLEPAAARAIGENHLRMDIWDDNGGLTEESVQATMDFLTEHAALPAETQVRDVADLSYLNSVLDEIGRR